MLRLRAHSFYLRDLRLLLFVTCCHEELSNGSYLLQVNSAVSLGLHGCELFAV